MSKPAIVVFGATGGIGSILCRLLAPDYHLFLSARGEERLAALSQELGCGYLRAQASNFSEVEAVFAAAQANGLNLKGAVNCVGSILLKPAHLTTEAEFDETIDLNLKTAFAVCRSGARALTKEGGSIVLFSSAAAQVGLPNHEAIAAAKAGISGLTRSAAASYAGRGIRVNAIAPGLVDTPLAARITGNPKSLEASQAMHPLGRIGRPEEVAAAAAWLLDPSQSFITGQVLGIDGGLANLRGRG